MILNILIYIFTGLISLLGIILTFLSIPGVWLIWISTLLIALVEGFTVITPTILMVLFAISLLSTFIDNIVNILGVKAMGGTVYGMIGAILGGIVGLIVGNIFGFVFGPLIGAFLFEYAFARKTFNQSLKAGFGTFLGMLLTIVLKTGVNVGIVIYVINKLITS
jgi:hypothetical protein